MTNGLTDPISKLARALLPSDVRAMEITNRRRIASPRMGPEASSSSTASSSILIWLDQQVQPGAVEEWPLVNKTGEKHVFHIHQTEFLVTQINGLEQDLPGLRDVIDLPFMNSEGTPGVVKIIIPFNIGSSKAGHSSSTATSSSTKTKA